MTQKNYSVAVIVTTYNSPAYLDQVLSAYAKQTIMPDELIVADDGSTSDTAEVVNKFKFSATFTVHHVWHQDLGFRAAKIRNEAVKTIKSDYMIFTDGDCVPHPCFIEDHIKLIQAGSFVQGKRMLVSKKASSGFTYHSTSQLIWMCLQGKLSGCHHLLRIPGLAINNVSLRGIKTCNMALFRSDFVAVNGFDEDFTGWGREDAELAVRLFNYGLSRRDPPFSAVVFHLWHNENSRALLNQNDLLLEQSEKFKKTFCRNGLYKNKS